MTAHTAMQLDALRELANIGSGQAATSLSQMVGRSVDIDVPHAEVLPITEAVARVGSADEMVTVACLGVDGDLPSLVLLIFRPTAAATLCGMLGVEPESELAPSALGEVGNILGVAYVTVLGQMSGLELVPQPPDVIVDSLASVVVSALAVNAQGGTDVLLLDSHMHVEDSATDLTMLYVPSPGGMDRLLAGIGMA